MGCGYRHSRESGYSPVTRTQNLNVKLERQLKLNSNHKMHPNGKLTWRMEIEVRNLQVLGQVAKSWWDTSESGSRKTKSSHRLRFTPRSHSGWRCGTLAEGRGSGPSYLFVINQEVHPHPNLAISGTPKARQGWSWLNIQLNDRQPLSTPCALKHQTHHYTAIRAAKARILTTPKTDNRNSHPLLTGM